MEIRYAATYAVPNPCQVEAQIGTETETILLVDAAVWESQHDFGCSSRMHPGCYIQDESPRPGSCWPVRWQRCPLGELLVVGLVETGWLTKRT